MFHAAIIQLSSSSLGCDSISILFIVFVPRHTRLAHDLSRSSIWGSLCCCASRQPSSLQFFFHGSCPYCFLSTLSPLPFWDPRPVIDSICPRVLPAAVCENHPVGNILYRRRLYSMLFLCLIVIRIKIRIGKG